MGKRYHQPKAKPGELKIAYGRDEGGTLDICFAWGGAGADKSDGGMLCHALDNKRLRYSFPSGEIIEGPSIFEELEARGYDITTFKLTVQQKVVE